jgi:hypothetical protein
MNCKHLLLVTALGAMLSQAQPAPAGIVVNDTWIDDSDADPASPAYSELGVDADSDGDIESAWFQGGVGGLDPVAGGGPGPLRGDLTAGGASSASWTTYFTPDATALTLANNGDRLRVTWSFVPTNVNAANTSQNFRFALVDAGLRSTVNSSLPSTTYDGYAMFANMAQTLGNSNPYQLRERAIGAGNLLNTSGDWSVLANGATTGADGYDSGAPYTLTWTMTRAGTGLDINVTMSGAGLDNDGAAVVQFTDATPDSFSYDTFSVRPSGATTTAELFDTTLFRVEFFTPNVPEPASLAMFGIGAVLLATRRR